MIRSKWISLGLIILISTSPSLAQVQLSTDDLELEQRILSSTKATIQNQTNQTAPKPSLGQLQAFMKRSKDAQPACVDAKKVPFADKYVLTYDAAGTPCRIYDLSFPNLKALLKTASFFKVPVRNLTSKDFINALDEDWNAIQNRNWDYTLHFNPKMAAKTSFISTLKFKNKLPAVRGSQSSANDVGLPVSFTLADLDIDTNLQLPTTTKTQMAEILNDLEADTALSAEKSSQIRQYFLSVMNKPEAVLASVKFNWNDLNKVYDVFIDGDFLPLMGPVELINFQTQYKGLVEKMFRGILSNVLVQLPRLIPNRTIGAIVEVAIEDIFEQIDVMYEYQTNRLEQTLKNINSYSVSAVDMTTLENRALNILYGQKADLMSSYIMSVVQGLEFDWQAFEKKGKSTRYAIEKQRQILMDKTHSNLVLNKNCKTEIVNEYFAICYKNGVKDSLYSLISEQNIAFKSLGAPLIHRYKRPFEVSAIRGGTWLLSVGLRVVGLPLSRGVTLQLNSSLKKFMRAGVVDEAYLQNDLYKSHLTGQISMETQNILSWLYIQNLNPFMPKTMKFENALIAANKSILGIN
ncbi:MAG: hypothetical protein JNL11_05900 [Bdellovibrionaceae bacterium]|nr:hypothetical protein [Pseudobdellovibrionaceae bacterium]